jgi:branched-chain amino acid transport system substrate-binding protein
LIGKLIITATAAAMLAGGTSAQTIRIGLSGPFTGSSAAMGVPMRDGAKLAASRINQAGGIEGQQIVLVERDDEGIVERGVEIAQELIGGEHVVATVGFVNNDVALASQRFYETAEIPVLNAVATGARITHQFEQPEFKANYIFRIAVNEVVQADMIVREAVTRSGFKRPALLVEGTDEGTAGRKYLLKALQTAGVKPVADATFNVADTNVGSRLAVAKLANADVILTFGRARDLANIANSMGLLGWKLPILGDEDLSSSAFIDKAGANGEGASMPQTFIQTGDTEKRAAFIAAYQTTYRVIRMDYPDAAAQGYDSVWLLKAAIEQAGSTQGPKIRAALENLGTKVEGVVTTYNRPFSASDHEAITANIPVFGIVRNRHVVVAHEEDIAGDRAVRMKP